MALKDPTTRTYRIVTYAVFLVFVTILCALTARSIISALLR